MMRLRSIVGYMLYIWDVETMRLREEYKIRNGGIGSGELQDPYIPQDDNAENVNSVNGSVEVTKYLHHFFIFITYYKSFIIFSGIPFHH